MARINTRSKKVLSRNEVSVSNEESSPLMTAFTKALNNALDESSEHQIRASRPRKNKTWKYQKAKSERVKLNTYIPKSAIKSSAKSDSDSSLDNWIDHQMDISRKVFSHCSDSDEVIKTYNSFSNWRNCLNAGESDSVTESAHCSRELRKRRKFKRMTIDSPAKSLYFPKTKTHNFSQKNRRNRSIKLPRNLKVPVKRNYIAKISDPQLTSKMKGVCPNKCRRGTAYGKRKREEKSSESSNDVLSFYEKACEGPYSIARWTASDFSMVDSSENPSVSRHSSSDSECEQSTNDESREADDEQSDFFWENGSSEVLKSEDEFEFEEEDCDDLTAGYCHMLELQFDTIPAFRLLHEKNRKKMYEALKKKVEENGGNVEANQRRLLRAYQSFSYLSDKDRFDLYLYQNRPPRKK